MPFTNYHPVFLDLRNRKLLIVGGGEVAAEKIRSLLHAEADITVVSPQVIDCIRLWAHEGAITWVAREFELADVDGAFMSIGATDDMHLNRLVADSANDKNRLGNSVDDPGHCNFIMAAIARQGPIQVAISSSGSSPALAQRIRDKIINEVLTEEVGSLADFLGAWRPEVLRSLPTYQHRKAFWERVIDSDIPNLLADRGRDAADRAMRALLDGAKEPSLPAAGKVFLVGAGPGDPKLLTVRALELLRKAEVVMYDRLVNPEILRHCGGRSECIYVGKKLGTPGQDRQDAIHELLINYSKAGKMVVRLKGGDPFVFGRGFEEVTALARAGIECEVVPGISSAIAVPSAAGIPVTHRGVANGFSVFTGHREHEEPSDIDLAPKAETSIYLMAVERLPAIVQRLIASGKSASTPVAVIADGTLPSQKTIVGTLQNIVQLSEGVASPAVVVVGEVVSLRAGVSERAAAGR